MFVHEAADVELASSKGLKKNEVFIAKEVEAFECLIAFTDCFSDAIQVGDAQVKESQGGRVKRSHSGPNNSAWTRRFWSTPSGPVRPGTWRSGRFSCARRPGRGHMFLW